MKRFDFLLLDADGTLFDFERSEARALEQVLDRSRAHSTMTSNSHSRTPRRMTTSRMLTSRR